LRLHDRDDPGCDSFLPFLDDPAKGRPMTEEVLIVDDDPSTAAAMRAPLNDAGFTVDAALDGLTAIHRLRDRQYAAVVIDPRIRHALNGFAVLSYIEHEQPETLP